MGLMSRFAVVSVVGIAVLLAILYEMSEAPVKEERTEAAPVVSNPAQTEGVREGASTVVEEVSETVSKDVTVQESESLFGKNPVPKPTPVEDSKQKKSKQPEEREKKMVNDAPKECLYTVRKGDTLYSIARRVYGDGKMWTAIWKANKGVIEKPSQLAAGIRLRLPEPDEEKEETEYETYIVQKGDTLSKISRLHYGTSRFVDLILKANRDRIRKPETLRVGMLVRIPPLPENKER